MKTKFKAMILRALFVFLGIVTAFLFNLIVVGNMIIPDPCYYHNHDYDTSWLFDQFYHFPSAEAGHPVPTTFNTGFALVVGAFLGWLVSRSFVQTPGKKRLADQIISNNS
jgi:hypothetical protein